MTFGENVRLALAGLWANKLRAILTLLGIIIGIASVVTILTISRGVTSAVTDSLGSLGGQDMYLSVDTKDNIAKAKSRQAQSGSDDPTDVVGDSESTEDEDMSGDSGSGSAFADSNGDDQYLTPEILDQIREEFSDQVKGISVQGMGSFGTAKGTAGDVDADVQTTNQDFLIGSNMEMVAGRGFDAGEIESADTVAVITDILAKKLFGGAAQNAVGQSFEFDSDESQMTFQVIGVARQVQMKGAANALISGGGPSGDSFYIPYTLEEEISGVKDPGFNWATLRPIPGTDAKALKHDLQEFLDKAWADSDYGVEIDSMDSMMDEIKNVFSTISLGLSVIAGLSLLVGGIGVMNIMLVSVTERTREIGIRKALGATQWNIRMQFLVEAMMVCLLGGILGVALGGLAGYLGSNAMGNPAIPPLGGVLFSLAFSLGIGIFFGYYPASKAAKLDPIEALRYE
ncbi:ABC transporter permease [Mobiluncus sp.]|uniref:ABC transporter permease n=1 Tax=Mobiluncus sp. TaxID=47293 RepID=UPI002A918DF4|nr:ABC transporter permease [Mobiluncus sp.]MDY6076130.1 ABC transporter permease [Mobiluncus sp.]